MIKEIKNELLGEKYYSINHSSGLKIFIMPKERYSSSYAVFGTKFGSVNNAFTIGGKEIIRVPDGTAHFLEHKLFESEEKDAFEQFAATGANANAFTSFDRTCYLFSCSENFYKNLETLLDFVQAPYFTEKTVEKEQGIIGQEIEMYADSPEWQATMNLLAAMYKNNPVNTDIAGSEKSIAAITPDVLYAAYNAYYNLNNMALSIAGNVDVEKILKICDERLKPASEFKTVSVVPEEPDGVVKKKITKKMDVSLPIFAFGYKEKSCGAKGLKERFETVILNEILIGGMSPLYQKLVKDGIVNESFSSEYFNSDTFSAILFTGESTQPEKVKSELEKEIERLRKDGIDGEIFDCVVKELYGEAVMSYNLIDNIAQGMFDAHLSGSEIFAEMEFYKNVKVEDAERRLKEKYNIDNSAISLILPTEVKNG